MRIGIDLGGTKIEGILIDGDGAELSRLRIATPRAYHATLNAIAALVAELDHVAHSARTASAATGQIRNLDTVAPSVGIGIPGAIVPDTALVKNANSTWLIGQPLQRDLETLLSRNVRVSNDANCFALSEAGDGAGAGYRVVFGVILGTGVGGGIVIDGQPLDGTNLIAGEWGHNPLPWPDDDEHRHANRCYCGRSGCIETWLSGPGFEHHFARVTSRRLSSHDIIDAAKHGDDDGHRALVVYITRLAKSLAVVVNVIDPDVIVLGGGMSNLPELASSVGNQIGNWTFSPVPNTRVVRNRHGDSSGVRGAAWLWPA